MTRELVGQLRPSQLLFSFGVGGLVDLPHMTVMPLGLDDWHEASLTPIQEDRLLAAVRHRLGPSVERLARPPVAVGTESADAEVRGVPTVPFPRWLFCSACRTLAPLAMDLFRLRAEPGRPDETGFVHEHCRHREGRRAPRAFPVRFLVACRAGHLDDFPWLLYVHRGPSECRGPLRLLEKGVTGEASDVQVSCQACDARRLMAEAFDRRGEGLASCRGRRVHLRDQETAPCPEPVRAVLAGASNLWFPITLSVLALPVSDQEIDTLVAALWPHLSPVTSREFLSMALAMPSLRRLASFGVDEIWAAMERRRRPAPEPAPEAVDVKGPEWRLFTSSRGFGSSADFTVREEPVPHAFSGLVSRVLLVERLREVQALTGFTRIEAASDPLEGEGPRTARAVPLSRGGARWVPAAESRGEGIFLRLDEEAVERWARRPEVRRAEAALLSAHTAWRRKRKIAPPGGGFPGMRFVLVHTLSHALLRQIALDCGYAAASLRERLYVREPGEAGAMAGLLLYTAASDSEGTLGGLVSQGRREALETHLGLALESARLCSSDPLCGETRPDEEGRSLNGASCHACLLSPETSCERGNRYLDRAALVPIAVDALAFFGPG